MIRFAVLAACSAACGRSSGMTGGAADQELPGLVVEARKPDAPIDVERAVRDSGELGRALAQPYRIVLAAIGPHTTAVNTTTAIAEAGKPVSELSDHAQLEDGESGAFRAVYTNSADYGRETTFVDGKLYLRPRYQRWHARAPEAPDEPAELRDQYVEAGFAMWDLLAPGAALTDGGAVQLAGRTGRKIEISRAPHPAAAPAEPLNQRAWRQQRTIDAVEGEIVLDAAKGVPLAIKLTGSVGYTRDGRQFAMKVAVDSTISGLGRNAEVVPPPDDEIVATPERLREVDDRDFLLKGIAPPLRKADTTAPAAPTNPKPRPGASR